MRGQCDQTVAFKVAQFFTNVGQKVAKSALT